MAGAEDPRGGGLSGEGGMRVKDQTRREGEGLLTQVSTSRLSVGGEGRGESERGEGGGRGRGGG